MKKHLRLFLLFLLQYPISVTWGQVQPTFKITIGGREVSAVCLGLSPLLTPTSGGTDFSWNFGNGNTGTGISATPIYTTPGTYTITLKDNTTGQVGSKQITINDAPKASYNASSLSSCTGTAITLNSTSTSSTPINFYRWDFNDGSGSNTATPSVSKAYNSMGTYTPSLIVQDQNGCTSASTNNASIQIGGADLQVSFQANGTLYYSCDNNITFTNTTNENGKTGISYVWDFGDNTTSNQKNPGTHTYIPGVYTVTSKASYGGNTGCAPGYSKTIYIGKPNINITAPASICTNASFPLSATVSITRFANTQTDFIWQLDNGVFQPGNNTGIFYNTSGSKQIKVTNINGCSNPTTINMNVLEAPQFSLSTIPTMGACTETFITFTTTASSNNIIPIQRYNWTAGDGSPSTGTISNPSYTHRFTNPGTYTASVNATNTAGCSSTMQIPISIIDDCTDYGFGTAYNPTFSFYSIECDNKYTIVIKNKIASKPVSQWMVDGVSYAAIGDSATVQLTPPTIGTVSKKYTVKTIYQSGGISDTKQIGIIDEKADFKVINTENSTKLCANNKFIFSTDSLVNPKNISQYNWIIVDSIKQDSVIAQMTGNAPSFSFPKPGTYYVKLTVADIRPIPCLDSIVKKVNVQGIAINLQSDSTTFCYPTPTTNIRTTIINSTRGLQSISWNMGDGTLYTSKAPINDTTIIHSYNYIGSNYHANYTINIAAEDSAGCKAILTQSNFINIYLPKASFSTADTLLCGTNKVVIQNNSNVPNGDYIWQVGSFAKNYSNRSAFNKTFAPAPTNPSTMDVYLKLTVGGCSHDTLVKDYIRFTKPKPALNIANNAVLTDCPPYTLILKNNSTDTKSVQWTITDRQTSTYNIIDSLFYTLRHPGPTSIKLIATLGTCSDSAKIDFLAKGPIATLGILDTIGCTPYASRMKIDHNNDVKGFQWDFQDGTPILNSTDADSVKHIYKNAGIYLPKVLVTGQEGCIDSLDIPAKIVAEHLSPTFSAFNVLDKCTMDTAKFINKTQIGTIPVKQYTWNWGNQHENNSSKDTISHVFPDSSLYVPVSLTATTDFCAATSDTVMASPRFANHVSIQGNNTFCDNVSLHLTGLAVNTPNHDNTYNWYTQNDSLLFSSKDSILNIPMTASFSNLIKLKFTNALGCTKTVTQNILMLKTSTITLQDSIKVCQGDSVILQARGNGNFSWQSNESLKNGTTASPTIFPTKNNYYYATLTNGDNCVTMDSIWVQVHARIGTSFLDDYKVCLTDPAPTKITVNSKLPAIFIWTALPIDNNLAGIIAPTISVKPLTNTSYHFIAHSNNVCPDETGDILLQYTPAPTITFSATTLTQSAGTVFKLNPNIVNLAPSAKFTWSPDIRLDNRYWENPTAIADKDITYRLDILDEYGCTASNSISIKVLCNASKILMANAFTPNGDGKNDRFFVTGYGIKNVISFVVINRWGQKIFERNNISANDITQGWDGTINGKQAESGTYLYIGEVECTEGNKIPIKGSVVLIR